MTEKLARASAAHGDSPIDQAPTDEVSQLIAGTFDSAPVCMAYLSADLRFVRVNRAYAASAGRNDDERQPEFFVGKRHFELFPDPESEQLCNEVLRTGVARAAKAQPFEMQGQDARGTTHWDWVATPVFAADQTTVGLVVASIDVTDRVRALGQAQESERQLRAALKSRETLLRELHHRVKNNLSVVISLLSLEASRSTAPEAVVSLSESAARVRAIAVVHELLSHAADHSSIDALEHLRRLGRQLQTGLLPDVSPSIVVESDLSDASGSLDIEQAVPLSLLAHELISNAIRHAFKRERGFEGNAIVRVTIARAQPTQREGAARDAPTRLRLIVEDNGVGISASVDVDAPQRLGLRLVHRLAAQLGGAPRFERSGGTRVTVEFEQRSPQRGEGL